jgi:transposase
MATLADITRGSSAVQRAVKVGTLLALAGQHCTECGKPAQAYHHHHGYNQEHLLDVVPVCDSCHARLHRWRGHKSESNTRSSGALPVGAKVGLAEAAALAGVHRRTLIYAIEHGRLEAEQVSGVWITTRSAVEAWQRHAKHKPGPAKGTKRQERHAHGGSDGD